MKKVLGIIIAISATVMLFGFALTIGSVVSEASWVFATTTAIAFMVFAFANTAEWFYDKGKGEAE